MKNNKELKYYALEDRIFKGHNNGVVREIIEANFDNLEKTAIFYRGNKIIYSELILNVYEYAKALKARGFKKGDEIPVCMSNTPEAVTLFLAISLIGAKVNAISDSFSPYYVKYILKKVNSPVFFVTNDKYKNIDNIVEDESSIKDVVVFSLSDSYPRGINPYAELESHFISNQTYCIGCYKSKAKKKNILDKTEFLSLSKKFNGTLEEKSNLEDVFYIGYEMDAKISECPKALEYKNKNFIVSGIMKRDASAENPSVLAQLPNCYSAGMISLIFDTLFRGGTICLEYVNSKTFFPASLIINKSNIVYAPKEYWISLFKELQFNYVFGNVNSLSYLTTPVSILDPLSKNEEKYLNAFLKYYKAGKKNLGSCAKMSQVLVNSLYGEAFLSDSKQGGAFHASDIIETTVVNSEGKHLQKENYGLVVLNSRCSIASYRDSKQNDLISLSTFDGHKWISTNYLGKLNKTDGITIRGKLSHPQSHLAIAIKEVVLQDEKNILSCEVVPIDTDEKQTYFVVHLTLMPGWLTSAKQALSDIEKRLKRFVPPSFVSKIVYRIRNNDFVLQPSGKIDESSLIKDGFDKTVKVYSVEEKIYSISGEEHVQSEFMAKKKAYKMKPISRL